MEDNEYSSRDELDFEAEQGYVDSEEERRQTQQKQHRLKQQQALHAKSRSVGASRGAEWLSDADENTDEDGARGGHGRAGPGAKQHSVAATNTGHVRSGGRLALPQRSRRATTVPQNRSKSIHDDYELDGYAGFGLEDDDVDDLEELRDEDEVGSANEDEDGPAKMNDEDLMTEIRGPVLGICSALGGYEDVEVEEGIFQEVYVPGDDCLGCLRDLRKLWRRDDDDPSRRVARVFAQVNVLRNDIVPILLATAGKGERGNKIALACADLMTSMTWPIDIENELRVCVERGEDNSHIARLPPLEKAQVGYKASILKFSEQDPSKCAPGQTHDVLGVIVREILLPSLCKPRPMRSERDNGTISMCLHLFRNLLAIRDPPATSDSTPEAITNSRLQSLLIEGMERANVLEILLMLCSSAEERNVEAWNAIAMDCVYQIYVGTKPGGIAAVGSVQSNSVDLILNAVDADLKKAAEERAVKMAKDAAVAKRSAIQSSLTASLNAEANIRRKQQMQSGTARHTRFGTTISFIDDEGKKRVARNTGALRKNVKQLTEEVRKKETRRKARRRKAVREEGGIVDKPPWTSAAALLVKEWADRFVKQGFEPLTRALWKAIRSEDAKMGDLDQARIKMMQLGAWFLEYYLSRRQLHTEAYQKRQDDPNFGLRMRGREPGQAVQLQTLKSTTENGVDSSGRKGKALLTGQDLEDPDTAWPFSLVFEWSKPWAMRMVLVRTDAAHEAKAWLEFVTAVDLWTILFRLIDALSRSELPDDQVVGEAAQEKLFYDNFTLDYCRVVMGAYKAQSFATLRAIVDFTFHMPRMLERYCENKEHIFVRAKKRLSKKAQDGQEEDVGDDADANRTAQETYKERSFQFKSFQRKLCTKSVAVACVQYLQRWKEFLEPDEQMARVVGVMHRLAIKAGSPQIFFPKDLRHTLEELSNPNVIAKLEAAAPAASNDLKKMLAYILRKWSKLPSEEKHAYEKGKRPPRPPKAEEPGREVMVKPGKPIDQQIGIAIGRLMEMGKTSTVMWVKGNLEMASAQRRQIMLRMDGDVLEGGCDPMRARSPQSDLGAKDNGGAMQRRADLEEGVPSNAALRDFEPYDLRYDDDDKLRDDASKLPELKMLCRLVGLEEEHDIEGKEWTWTVPVSAWPLYLDADIKTMDHYLANPYVPDEGQTLKDYIKKVAKPRASRAPAEWEEDVDAIIADYSVNSGGSSSDSDASAGALNKRREKLENLRRKAKIPSKRLDPKAKKAQAPVWSHNDYIENSDEELAAINRALGAAEEGDRGAGRRRDRASSRDDMHDSDDDDLRKRPYSSPPTSSPPAAAPSRTVATRKTRAKQRVRHSSNRNSDSDSGQSRRAAFPRRPAAKRDGLFLGGSDEEDEEEADKLLSQSPVRRVAHPSLSLSPEIVRRPFKDQLFLGSSQDRSRSPARSVTSEMAEIRRKADEELEALRVQLLAESDDEGTQADEISNAAAQEHRHSGVPRARNTYGRGRELFEDAEGQSLLYRERRESPAPSLKRPYASDEDDEVQAAPAELSPSQTGRPRFSSPFVSRFKPLTKRRAVLSDDEDGGDEDVDELLSDVE
ncbi:hypothetical protein K437DRAFT_257784 [Tilletiaria anomala UBC 951]|uniref:Timeless N-terminal domain-containing protein n=1 Tax=Tilletiaria anomala (strain ATCC 24038 / CBS 436.72 / UBC 951) TaxID=1037660 RepID=A0A066VM67_TILAU|nr:uncharacterized protein K437DRAFT_257784 [Tilletiaria anomala UBC 951]KDN42601.1 hypothetical protein K437DRAFT_257784 [Tilletiaria anomala UBC 951]